MKKLPEVKPTEKEAVYIAKYYGSQSANEMANALQISINRVYNICRKLELTRMNVRMFFTVEQHQLIIGGILGDGNIKRNGSNYYYRETHSKKEKEYCKWKCDIFAGLVSKKGFHQTDKRDGQYGFQTINSQSFRWYKKLSLYEVIDELDDFGACVYLLDDGWMRPSGFNLSTGIMSPKEEQYLCDKLNKIFGTSATVISHNAISFKKKDMRLLLPYFKNNIPNNIDVYKHKIQPLINKFKV